jgi:hypothetical protein
MAETAFDFSNPYAGILKKKQKSSFDFSNPYDSVLKDTDSQKIPPEFEVPKPKTFDSAQEADQEERLSFAQLASDDEYMDMLRDYNNDRFGESGAQGKDETDEEYLKRFLTHTREFEFNSIDLGRQLDWVRNADKDKRIQFGYLYSQLERLPSFYEEGGTGYASAVRDFGKSLLTDPFNYIGFGAGAVAKQVAVRAIIKALKEGGKKAALKEAAKYGSKNIFKGKTGKIIGGGIVAEAGVAAVQDLKLQELEMLSEKQGEYTAEDYDYGRAGIAGGIGLGVGALGAKLSGGLGGEKLVNNATEAVTKQKKIKEALDARNASLSTKASDETTTQTATGIFDIKEGRETLDKLGTISDDADFMAQMQFNTELMKRVGKVVTDTVEEMATDGRLGQLVDEDTKASEVIGKLVQDSLAKAEGKSADAIKKQTEQLLTGKEGILKEIGEFSGDTLEAAISRAGLTNKQFVNAMGVSYSDAGKFLNTASNVGKIIKGLGEVDPELKAILMQSSKSDVGQGFFSKAHEVMNRLDRERRALMVTQIATTVRNVATGAVRLGMESTSDAMESTIFQLGKGFNAAMSGNNPLGSTGFSYKEIIRDSFGRLNRLRQVVDTAELSEALLKHNSRLASRMDRTLQEATDDESLSAFTRTMNGLNIAQDIFFRRAIFTNSIDKKLRRAGIIVDKPTNANQFKNLEEFIASGKSLPAKVLSDSVEESLSFTFSLMPQKGTVGHHFIKFTEAIGPVPAPVGTAAMPFARFMVNALQFQYNYSPLSSVNAIYRTAQAAHTKVLAKTAEDAKLGKALSDKASQQLAEARDGFSKATVGTAAFYAAIQYRSNNQDINFYEYKNADGTTGDLRPFFPLVPYLAVADLWVKHTSGDTDKINFKEVAEAFTGFQFRTGASSYILDNAEQLISEIGKGDPIRQERMGELLGGYAAELTGGYATPLRIVRDIQAAYDTEAAVIRDAKQTEGIGFAERAKSAFDNTLYKDLPSLSKGLPPIESPTREGDIYRQSPLLGQIGMPRREPKRNPAEEEFARLGIKTFTLVPNSGDKTADALVKKHLGPFVERDISELVQSDAYINATDTQKRGMLKRDMKVLRLFAKELAVMEAETEAMKGEKSFTPFDRAQYGKLTDIQTRLADEYYMTKYGKSVIEMVREEPNVNHYKRAIDLGKLLEKNL